MNPTFVKRNQSVIRALKNNTKKARHTMRDSDGNRCCLCVAEDTAIEDGLAIDKCSFEARMPTVKTRNYLGWDNKNPKLLILKQKGKHYYHAASEVNDSIANVPHYIIAEFMANTFTRKSFRLSKEARQFAKKLVDLQGV